MPTQTFDPTPCQNIDNALILLSERHFILTFSTSTFPPQGPNFLTCVQNFQQLFMTDSKVFLCVGSEIKCMRELQVERGDIYGIMCRALLAKVKKAMKAISK